MIRARRPWWRTALEKKAIAWSDMYISGTSREFTVSNVMPLYKRDGRLLAVSSADFNLLSLSLLLGTIKIAKTGKVTLPDPAVNRLGTLRQSVDHF